jgi:hypothetical protein
VAADQGAAGGIFPLAFGIVRDEFPHEKVAGSIGLLSAILGVGAGIGIVLSGVIVEHLDYHWLFWIPLVAIVLAAVATWRFIPESPIRVPGRINWLAAALMTAGLSTVLIAVSETTTWGWGSAKTLGLIAVGLAVQGVWIAVETRSDHPLIDMTMMRIRGVWTTNLSAFLLGAGMYASFIVFPQFAQLPKSTGFGFGASVVVSGLYLVAAALLGVGIGLAFAALGNLIVQAVPSHQTGVASGMNTVMRTLGGALGGQLSATFIAANVAHGEPTVTGFTDTFLMATGFLIVCLFAGFLVPKARGLGALITTAAPFAEATVEASAAEAAHG